MDKQKVAEILVDIGLLLELKGENPFKTRAYSNAARAIESLTEPLGNFFSEDRLHEIRGIGDSIQKKVVELVTTGKLKYYDDLKASIPRGFAELLEIPGMGPKRSRRSTTS
jgi:DNA polymerase (family 10)